MKDLNHEANEVLGVAIELKAHKYILSPEKIA